MATSPSAEAIERFLDSDYSNSNIIISERIFSTSDEIISEYFVFDTEPASKATVTLESTVGGKLIFEYFETTSRTTGEFHELDPDFPFFTLPNVGNAIEIPPKFKMMRAKWTPDEASGTVKASVTFG